jgi:GT2 family glycosyltransferase
LGPENRLFIPYRYSFKIVQIITLTTYHNRRGQTLASLADLHAQALPKTTSLNYVLVDDGSTDGTAAAVDERFPDVEIVNGSGNLFWAGGMRHGWEQAVSNKEFDYLFVYNDDVRLEQSALSHLLDAAANQIKPHVIVGSFLSMDGSTTTYGGRRRSSRWHPLKFAGIIEPDGTLQEADTLNMNGALISRSALSEVGFLSEYFVHGAADFEYGLKLRKAGGKVIVAGQHIGRCDLNPASSILPEHSERLGGSLQQLFDQNGSRFGKG